MTRHGRVTYITTVPSALDHFQVSAFSWIPQYGLYFLGTCYSGYRRSSFTNFIIAPAFKLSGRFYIRPDIYHTQITEYLLREFFHRELFSLCVERLPECYHSVRPSPSSLHHYIFSPNWSSFPCSSNRNDFLSESTLSEWFMLDYLAELKIDILKIIVQWLQVSVSERNRTPQTKIQLVSRDSVPSDQASCTIASRVNFNTKKLSLNFDFEV